MRKCTAKLLAERNDAAERNAEVLLYSKYPSLVANDWDGNYWDDYINRVSQLQADIQLISDLVGRAERRGRHDCENEHTDIYGIRYSDPDWYQKRQAHY